jgi:hypothetical protein
MSPNPRTGIRRLLGTLPSCVAAFAAINDFNDDARSDIHNFNSGQVAV